MNTLLFACLLAVSSFASTDYFETCGDVLEYAIPVAALALSVAKKDYDGSFRFCASYASSFAISTGLKYSVRETRPDGESQSFPSWHAASTFCGASFAEMRYGAQWGIPLYALSALTAWSRLEANRHYPWDVAAGAIIGITCSAIFVKWVDLPVSIAPVFRGKAVGALMRYSF